ncbi:MAG: DegV family EDD domain-containing protein, partial [Actinomycetia bacterium]|nr:DegV family EDD domain-containing protein [Actinomycetes bacterium]
MKIITDEMGPLSPEQITKYEVNAVKFPVYVNDEDYIYNSIEDARKLRDIVKEGNKVTTSGLREEDLLAMYNKYKDEKIVSFHIPEAFSSATYQTLRGIIKEKNFDITLIDSKATSAGFGLQLIEMSKELKKNPDFDSFISLINHNRKRVVLMTAFYDLNYLYRTGRIGYLKSKMGAFMKVIPLCIMRNETGIVETFGKARNPHMINFQILEQIKRDMKRFNSNNISLLFDCSGPHEEKMNELIEMIKNENWNTEIEIGEP